jgi:hypothetical protein
LWVNRLDADARACLQSSFPAAPFARNDHEKSIRVNPPKSQILYAAAENRVIGSAPGDEVAARLRNLKICESVVAGHYAG